MHKQRILSSAKMIDTTEKPKILSVREARHNNKFACYNYGRNNELVAYTDRESLVVYDSNVLELYSNDEGPSRTTVTEGLHLKSLQPSAGPIFSLRVPSSIIWEASSQGSKKEFCKKRKQFFLVLVRFFSDSFGCSREPWSF